MRPIVLGIDGGGTSTVAWLADRSGAILGRGQSGGSNLKAIGPEASKAALDQVIARAFDDAGLDQQRVDVACFGLAGFDRPAEKQTLESWSTRSGWADRLVLVNDGDLVVAAGTLEGWGVGLIAGTGSIAVGKSSAGLTARAGGWGYLLGDEGSGYAVALAGLKKVARRADGRENRVGDPDDLLTRLIAAKLGISGPADLISTIYRPETDRSRIAGLATAVVEAAGSDRSIVEEILEPAGVELARMVATVARKIGIHAGLLPLAQAGSFLLNCAIVANVVEDQLSMAGFRVIVTTVPDPVAGAVVLARRALNG